MLFGLGEGIGYIIWNMKNMEIPFIGGRIKPDMLTVNLFKNLDVTMEVYETTSEVRAWEMLKKEIDAQKVVGLKLDCYYLECFKRKFHFAVPYIAMYGYDNEKAYIVDTQQQGGLVETSLNNLALARNAKRPMLSHNRMYTIKALDDVIDIKKAILPAMQRNAFEYLHPSIQNLGYKGIIKTASEVKKWFMKEYAATDFCSLAMLMEKTGTGGGLFRNLYRDFIKESFNILKMKELKEIQIVFSDIAEKWTVVATLFGKAGKSGNIQFMHTASVTLEKLAQLEKKAFSGILNIKT